MKNWEVTGLLKFTDKNGGNISVAAGTYRAICINSDKETHRILGKEHFETLARRAGTDTAEDDTFEVRFAFFARTEADIRRLILEGRRHRLSTIVAMRVEREDDDE